MSIRSQKALEYGPFDYSSTKNSINFSYGLPDPETFYQLKWPQTLFSETGVHLSDLLQYTDSSGLPELRLQISQRYQTKCENVIVTGGASQGMQLLADAFINPGDVVLTEDPSYLGALRIFSIAGADVIQIAMDDEGVNLEDLEEALKKVGKNISFFYSSSVFHNPTGRLFTKQRMTDVANILQKHGIVLIQDLVYSELSYEDNNPEMLKADSNIINLHSFSKIAGPGLRVGWIIGEDDIIRKLSCLKRDGGVSAIASNTVLNLLRSTALDTHIKWLRSYYKNKRDSMFKILNSSTFCDSSPFLPQGGFSFWVKISDAIDISILINQLRTQYDIQLTAGVHYGPTSDKYVRLCFSYMPINKIEIGLQCMEAVYRKFKR